jgi:hypothetical protein
MKKLFLSICLILALPLLFSGQRLRGNPAIVAAQGCGNEVGSIGNCAAYKPSRHRHLNTKGSKESGNPEIPIVAGIGVLSFLLLTLWAMRS